MNAPVPKPIRSPSYPGMSLRDAVEEVAKIERLYRSAPVDRAEAARLMGYKMLSGPATKALAALASYGLLERAAKGETRVTERARDILHAASEEDRRRGLMAAALEPDLFREIRERFAGVQIPPEEGVITYLNRQGFNPNAVRPAARAFLETMSYLGELGATESHSTESQEEQKSEPRPAPAASAPQWMGSVAPKAAAKPDEGKLMEGERNLTTGMLSKDASFRVVVTGHVGVKEIERLIKKLEFDKDILAEQELDEVMK